MIREALKFAGAGGPVTLAAYDEFKWSDAVDCENFLQVVFELYPAGMTGALYYTLQFCDDQVQPADDSSWLPDPIDGTVSAGTAPDQLVAVGRQVRTWAGAGGIQVNSPLPHRWVRIGVAAGTSGTCMVIVKRLPLASR